MKDKMKELLKKNKQATEEGIKKTNFTKGHMIAIFVCSFLKVFLGFQ